MFLTRATSALLCTLVVVPVVTAGGPAVVDPRQADADFKVQGEYAGTLTLGGSGARYGLQVVAQGGGRFRGVLFTGGLPGESGAPLSRVEAPGESGESATLIKSPLWTASISKGVARFVEEGGKKVGQLRRLERKSPTLGARAPAGALVLFDGKNLDQWEKGARMSDDKSLMQGATSARKFGDATVHVEFRTPYAPASGGQGRGNSGIYLQGRYEVQVLDSFGSEGKINEAGAIYEVKPPAVNLAFPPLTWQTYDIEFTAAKYQDGKKVKNANVTVRHNGVVVQQSTEIPGPTRSAPVPEGPDAGPLFLQDHGDPVRFRNVWVVAR